MPSSVFIKYLYSMAMALSYGIIFGLNRSIKVSTRLTGISLIIIGLIHIEGLCLLFIPAAVGTHLFLLVIPLFSLILIAPRDWMFSSVFSLIALSSIVYLDWGRELFEPIYHIDFPKEILPAWRAISTGIVILFIMSVFWVFYHNLLKAR